MSALRAVIATGTGRYADAWHPFERTSDAIATALRAAGFDVAIDEVDPALASLDAVDLLVVNAGDPWQNEDPPGRVPEASVEGFADAVARGIGIVAIHIAVASLRDYPEWAAAIGGMWVPGHSHHPPIGATRVGAGSLPDGTTTDAFEVVDERYCRLQRIGRSRDVAHHDGPHGAEPTAWVREHGASRIAVDVLGHDERSYESVGHRSLLTALARWAAGPH